ncbi:hypothetical protein CL176_01475 [Suicoccus acidiformans]|uniref:Insertion element IS150 protein InsJ-like helix-turn-helix domain-containing protein n=1 Tax=Suicoccus acidiformans TaxID=2036206 RepID=A0A347WI84_9LACT|nr:hypothetical protein CL176_01475 [Suicoccus acidiformans]
MGVDGVEFLVRKEVDSLTKRRKTPEEKLAIVEAYLQTDLTYQEVADKYDVTYANVYAWVKKYQQQGRDGFIKPSNLQEAETESDLAETQRLKEYKKTLLLEKKFLEVQRIALMRKGVVRQRVGRLDDELICFMTIYELAEEGYNLSLLTRVLEVSSLRYYIWLLGQN